MRFELLGVLGEGLERLMNALAMLWCLQLLDIETPGEDTGQSLEKLVHSGLDTLLWCAVPCHHLSVEEERQDNEKQCKRLWASWRVHGSCLLSYA
jgi:hypothetical protein